MQPLHHNGSSLWDRLIVLVPILEDDRKVLRRRVSESDTYGSGIGSSRVEGQFERHIGYAFRFDQRDEIDRKCPLEFDIEFALGLQGLREFL